MQTDGRCDYWRRNHLFLPVFMIVIYTLFWICSNFWYIKQTGERESRQFRSWLEPSKTQSMLCRLMPPTDLFFDCYNLSITYLSQFTSELCPCVYLLQICAEQSCFLLPSPSSGDRHFFSSVHLLILIYMYRRRLLGYLVEHATGDE